MSAETENGEQRRRLNLREIKEARPDNDGVGVELRALRMQRGESLAQVSQALRIRKDLIEAIESGRTDALPGTAYAIGFVRSYADYLRLDPNETVKRYKAELAAQEAGQSLSFPVAEDEQRFSFGSVFVILLCLLAAGAGAWYLADSQGWLGGARPLGPQEQLSSGGPGGSVGPAPAPAPVATAPPLSRPRLLLLRRRSRSPRRPPRRRP